MHKQTESTGKVYLVGAGPGDPRLITLRGVQCLNRADLVLYDYLVNPAILDHAPAGAELVRLGTHRCGRTLSQEEINAAMIAAAKAGRTVVRLKGGDPDIFARSAEETEALAGVGIEYETVPGVTAALAAAGYAGIPVTHHQHASALALVTGHERQDKDSALNYAALARFPGTLIFYMGITSAGQWSESLIHHGRSPETPAMIVRRCTWNDQETIRCTLGTVGRTVLEKGIRPPAIIVVGEVVALAPEALVVRRQAAVRPANPGYPSPRPGPGVGRSVGGAGGPGDDPAGDKHWSARRLGKDRRGPGAAGPIRLAGLLQQQRSPLPVGSAGAETRRSAAARKSAPGGDWSRHGRGIGPLPAPGGHGARRIPRRPWRSAWRPSRLRPDSSWPERAAVERCWRRGSPQQATWWTRSWSIRVPTSNRRRRRFSKLWTPAGSTGSP